MAFQNSFTSQKQFGNYRWLLKSQNQFLLRLWCLESYEVDFLWPKLLNYQLMFCKSNFILWMSKLFDLTKIFFTTEYHLLNHIQNVLVFPKLKLDFQNRIPPKRWLGIKTFWTWVVCQKYGCMKIRILKIISPHCVHLHPDCIEPEFNPTA